MGAVRETTLVGFEALDAATVLLQRARAVQPTAGLFEVADLQWWWRTPRSTDDVPQLFWVDDAGRPVAAVVAAEWRAQVTLSPIVLPDASDAGLARVVERGVEHAERCGLDPRAVEIDRNDDALRSLLSGHGFTHEEEGPAVLRRLRLHAGRRRCPRGNRAAPAPPPPRRRQVTARHGRAGRHPFSCRG